MAIKVTFDVSANENADTRQVTVTLPTFDEATVPQRRRVWDDGLRNTRIKVQGTLRRALTKNPAMSADALNRVAQAAFTAALDGERPVHAKPVFDATALGFTRAQIDALVAGGATVVNIPAKLAGK